MAFAAIPRSLRSGICEQLIHATPAVEGGAPMLVGLHAQRAVDAGMPAPLIAPFDPHHRQMVSLLEREVAVPALTST